MICDRCDRPSSGPRCPICVHTYGAAPVVNRVFRVEAPTETQRSEDRRHGWESE